MVSDGELNEDGIPVAVLAKKSAFTPEEENAVRNTFARLSATEVLYAPSEKESNAFAQLIESNDPQVFSAGYEYNVTPVTDDAPFFFFTLKAGRLLHPHSNSSAMDWKVNLGVAVLGMLLFFRGGGAGVFGATAAAGGRNKTARHLGIVLLYCCRAWLHSS